MVADLIFLDISKASRSVLSDGNTIIKDDRCDLLPVLGKPWSLVVLEGIVRLLRMPLVQPVVCVIVGTCKAVSVTLILTELQPDLARLTIPINYPPNSSECTVLYLC